MTLKNDFATFLEEKVNLNQTRLDRLNKSVSALDEYLQSDEGLKPAFQDMVPQGSLAHRTIIRPQGDGEYDADVLVHMTPVDGWEAKDYITAIHLALGRSERYKAKRRWRSRCITLDYAGDFHIDVVPLVDRWDGKNICNRVTNMFERSAPDDFTIWLEGKGRETNDNLVKAIRLFKYLRDHKGTYTVRSVVLTALLGEQVQPVWDESKPYKDIPATLNTLASRLSEHLSNHPTTPPFVRDPGTGLDLASRWTPENYRGFRRAFISQAASINDAYETTDLEDAREKWRALFGDSFAQNTGQALERAVTAALSKAAPNEQFIDKTYGIPIHLDPAYKVKVVGYVEPKKGFRNLSLPMRGNQVEKFRTLRFKIEDCNVPHPHEVYWKIRNYGDEAAHVEELRGDMHRDDGGRSRKETTKYKGHHYVEAYVVRNGICVARSRQEVIVV